MFCSACGEKIADKAVICPKCGVATENNGNQKAMGKGLIIGSYVGAVLMPIVGMILGIYLLIKKQVGHGIGALVLSVFMFYFWSGFLQAFSRHIH